MTKHRTLQKEMINVGCDEIVNNLNEKVTMRFILNWLKDNLYWAPFSSTYNMFRKIKATERIDTLEDMMLEDERERREKQAQTDTARWDFPYNRGKKAEERTRGAKNNSGLSNWRNGTEPDSDDGHNNRQTYNGERGNYRRRYSRDDRRNYRNENRQGNYDDNRSIKPA